MILLSIPMKPLLTLILATLFFTQVTYAQETPTPDAPSGFISCEGRSCSACDFVVLGNTAIKWLITISFLFFAVLAVRAGIKLVTSQGNPGALQDAKSSFTNAFIGLVIILVAWLLVDTIMRQLVKGNGNIEGYGPWSEVRCSEQVESTLEEGYYPGDPEFEPLPMPAGTCAQGSAGCTGSSCVPLTIPCGARGCNIAPDMISRLESMHTQAGVAGARVTEAMPASRTHQSACHSNGTCVDYSKAGGMSGSEVKKVVDAAHASGLRPVYEVETASEKNRLVAEGAPDANIKVLPPKNGRRQISAPHFSIYAGTGQCPAPSSGGASPGGTAYVGAWGTNDAVGNVSLTTVTGQTKRIIEHAFSNGATSFIVIPPNQTAFPQYNDAVVRGVNEIKREKGYNVSIRQLSYNPEDEYHLTRTSARTAASLGTVFVGDSNAEFIAQQATAAGSSVNKNAACRGWRTENIATRFMSGGTEFTSRGLCQS